MKKILLLLLVISSLLAASCKFSFSSITEIEAVNTLNGEKIVISKDSEYAQSIIDALNKTEKSDKPTTDFFSYEINVTSSSGTDSYTLFFDVENKAAYVKKDDKLYKVRDKEARTLYLNELFSYIYVNETIYESFLELNGEKLVPETKYDWTYKNIEGQYKKSVGNLKNSDIKDGLTVSDSDAVSIKYETNPDSQVARLYSEGKLIATESGINEVLDRATVDGEYYVECQAQWFMKEKSDFFGSQTVSLDVFIDRTADVTIVTRENYPGNIMIVLIDNLNEDETATIQTKAVKIETEMYLYKDKNIYMYPIDLNTAPGDYSLTAVINQGQESEYTIEKILTVKSKSFKTQYLTVTDEMNETNNDNTAILEFAELVKPARTISTKEKLWEGTFIMPVEGELTTDFAEIRYVNNEVSSSRHSGLDLAAEKGTPVQAPNNGIVTFAMEGLLSPGNTVVIDHGMGLFTSYYHLNSIDVVKGQSVMKGEIIGTVGTTGFSTGPHLHYAVSIYNTYVNPYQTLSGIID